MSAQFSFSRVKRYILTLINDALSISHARLQAALASAKWSWRGEVLVYVAILGSVRRAGHRRIGGLAGSGGPGEPWGAGGGRSVRARWGGRQSDGPGGSGVPGCAEQHRSMSIPTTVKPPPGNGRSQPPEEGMSKCPCLTLALALALALAPSPSPSPSPNFIREL